MGNCRLQAAWTHLHHLAAGHEGSQAGQALPAAAAHAHQQHVPARLLQQPRNAHDVFHRKQEHRQRHGPLADAVVVGEGLGDGCQGSCGGGDLSIGPLARLRAGTVQEVPEEQPAATQQAPAQHVSRGALASTMPAQPTSAMHRTSTGVLLVGSRSLPWYPRPQTGSQQVRNNGCLPAAAQGEQHSAPFHLRSSC